MQRRLGFLLVARGCAKFMFIAPRFKQTWLLRALSLLGLLVVLRFDSKIIHITCGACGLYKSMTYVCSPVYL